MNKQIAIVIAIAIVTVFLVYQFLSNSYSGNLIKPYFNSAPGSGSSVYSYFRNVTVVNYTGFSVYNISGFKDYVLHRGESGTITYTISAREPVPSLPGNNAISFWGEYSNGSLLLSWPGIQLSSTLA